MILRLASPADAGKLALIGPATFLETFAHDHDGDEVVRYVATHHSPAYYADLLAGGALAWLFEEAIGCPVGYAVAHPAMLPGCDPARDYELKRLYLLSRWQGAGMGTQFYDAVEAEARASGYARLVLSVYVRNFAAQKFYMKRGFTQVGRWLFDGFTDSEDFILAKTL